MDHPSPPVIDERGHVDITGVCRHWIDSNGHVFTISHAVLCEPTPGRDWDVVLHGTSSGCTCRFIDHDGPRAHEAELSQAVLGNIFGYDPQPRTVRDMTTFVQRLLDVPDDIWTKHVAPAIDHVLATGDYKADLLYDLDDALDPGARTASMLVCEDATRPHWAATMRALRPLEGVDAAVVAACLIGNTKADLAVGFVTDLSLKERKEFVRAIAMMTALSGNPVP